MVGFARRAVVFTSLCFTTTLASECVGSHCEVVDETSLVQIKRHLHTGNQRAEQDVSLSNPKVARIIGSTFGLTQVQADAVSDLLQSYDSVHWDGDGVEKGSFTGALLASGTEENPITPFVIQESQYAYKLENPLEKTVTGHYLPDTPPGWFFSADNCKVAELKCKTMKKVCECAQLLTEDQVTAGSTAVTKEMNGDDWDSSLGGSAKYLSLAAADNIIAQPSTIYWLLDEDRGVKGLDKDKQGAPLSETPEDSTARLAGWVSLAEWYAFCDVHNYVIIDKMGELVTPDATRLPWSVTAVEMGWGKKTTPCGR